MKTQRGVEVQLYSFFNLGTRWVWVVNATPRPPYPRAFDTILTIFSAVETKIVRSWKTKMNVHKPGILFYLVHEVVHFLSTSLSLLTADYSNSASPALSQSCRSVFNRNSMLHVLNSDTTRRDTANTGEEFLMRPFKTYQFPNTWKAFERQAPFQKKKE